MDVSNLYKSVLKVVLMQYINEARFQKAIPLRPSVLPDRKSRTTRENEPVVPSYLVPELKTRLNSIAMGLSKHDEATRRSLLRFYSDLLDPTVASELRRATLATLVMKFVSAANKELVKLSLVPPEEISSRVFRQTELFIQIIKSLVQKDKNSAVLVAKLNEHSAALQPKADRAANHVADADAKYPKIPFKVSDMDQAAVLLLCSVFDVDEDRIQADVLALKATVSHKALAKDVEQVLFYTGKDIGKYAPNSFADRPAYEQWKEREILRCEGLLKKYAVPVHMKLLAAPQLPVGDEFYIMPSRAQINPFFTVLAKLLLEHALAESMSLQKPARDLLASCGRLWRLDPSTRAVCFYSAAHMTGHMVDALYRPTNSKGLGPIDVEAASTILEACKRMVEEGGLEWDDKQQWSLQDQEEWVKSLGYTYSLVMQSIKDCVSAVLSKSVKPKFGPYLTFLGEYVESDSLFSKIQGLGAPAKWEKKLSKTLLRASEALYAELLATLPRDNTVSIVHILDICEELVGNIRMLQKRYKFPLLDFLNVSHTYASVVTEMFGSDANNILKHIVLHVTAQGQFLNYGDALEAYKSLCEIRSIHGQVCGPQAKFAFDLESFFFPYLESWVKESSDKIKSFVSNALTQDDFQPVDIESDTTKHSSSVHDIFSLIKQYLGILRGLDWQNEAQLAKVYTTLTQSVSASCRMYASELSDIIMEDLAEEKADDNGEKSGWLDEVKSMVTHLGNDKVTVPPFNFTPRTCIGLNNLSAMVTQLSKLEEVVDPVAVSATMAEHDPASKHHYTSHVFSIRLVKAENVKASSDATSLRLYATLADTQARRMVAKTRTLETDNPEWDEEFELTLEAHAQMTLLLTIWEERFGTHGVCGRALIQLEPRKFKHDGIPQEVFLDLDTQGRVLTEIAVESERDDAMFAFGRAHRTLKRSQQRITKMIVAKFSRFIRSCISRQTLKAVCGNGGNIKPSQEQMDEAMMPLYNYLNMNLAVLAQYLTKELLVLVMLEAWHVVVACADELLLPQLKSSRALKMLKNVAPTARAGWQSAVSTAVANVTSSMNYLGFGKTLTANEIETVIGWINFLCIDFFYNEGNGPPVEALKNDQYQLLLLIPVYYETDVEQLKLESERLAPAYLETLRDKNNVFASDAAKLRSRAGSIARRLTIRANATAKERARAEKEARELRADPLTAQTSAENIILRLLLLKGDKAFVAWRLEQRERLAHTIATERLARAAAEGTFR